MRRYGHRDVSDERTGGNGDCVEQIIKEADHRVKRQLPENSRQKIIVGIIRQICDERMVRESSPIWFRGKEEYCLQIGNGL